MLNQDSFDATAVRRMAVLLSTLDPASAAAVLAELPLEQQQRVQTALSALGPISDAERIAVTGDFWHAVRGTAGSTVDGKALANDGTADPAGPQLAETTNTSLATVLQQASSRTLRELYHGGTPADAGVDGGQPAAAACC